MKGPPTRPKFKIFRRPLPGERCDNSYLMAKSACQELALVLRVYKTGHPATPMCRHHAETHCRDSGLDPALIDEALLE